MLNLSVAYRSVAYRALSTVAGMIEACALKTHGRGRWTPCFMFAVANCNLKAANSQRDLEQEIGRNVSWKRSGQREAR